MRIRLLLLLSLSSIAACYGSSGPNNPGVTTVHYPSSVLTVGDGTTVLVANTGLDRKYDSGHLSVVDVDDNRVSETGVLTGLFGGGMALSKQTNARGERFLVLPTRDDDLLELFALSLDNDIIIRRCDRARCDWDVVA